MIMRNKFTNTNSDSSTPFKKLHAEERKMFTHSSKNTLTHSPLHSYTHIQHWVSFVLEGKRLRHGEQQEAHPRLWAHCRSSRNQQLWVREKQSAWPPRPCPGHANRTTGHPTAAPLALLSYTPTALLNLSNYPLNHNQMPDTEREPQTETERDLH